MRRCLVDAGSGEAGLRGTQVVSSPLLNSLCKRCNIPRWILGCLCICLGHLSCVGAFTTSVPLVPVRSPIWDKGLAEIPVNMSEQKLAAKFSQHSSIPAC